MNYYLKYLKYGKKNKMTGGMKPDDLKNHFLYYFLCNNVLYENEINKILDNIIIKYKIENLFDQGTTKSVFLLPDPNLLAYLLMPKWLRLD